MTTNIVKLSVLTASLLFASGTALSQPKATGPTTTAPGGAATQAQQQDNLAGDDKDFVENAAQSGFMEVEASKLAQQKASSADVKAFADQMVKDHTAANEELASIASAKGLKASTEPSLMQKGKLKLLSGKDGKDFDEAYADTVGVAAHEDAVELFQKAVNEVKDPELKAYAEKTLPKLQGHLEMAKQLQQKVTANK